MIKDCWNNRVNHYKRQLGLTLVELLVAMGLGLMLISYIVPAFITQNQSYRANIAVAQMQDNARYVSDLLGLEFRVAGGMHCGRNIFIANVVKNSSSAWWSHLNEGLRGFSGDDNSLAVSFGTGLGERVTNTDAVIVSTAILSDPFPIVDHDPDSFEFELKTDPAFEDGEVLAVCDVEQAAVLQLDAYDEVTKVVSYKANDGTPGNCTTGLGLPLDCTTTAGTKRTFAAGGYVTRLESSAWFIGNNSRGTKSLIRMSLGVKDGGLVSNLEEVAEGISDMQLTYLERLSTGDLNNQYVEAKDVVEWKNVVASRVVLTLESWDKFDGNSLTRNWRTVFTIRDRSL